MVSDELLWAVALAQGAVGVGVLVLLFGHGFVVAFSSRRLAPKIERARAAARQVVGGGALEGAVAALRALPRAKRVELAAELAQNVSGLQWQRLSEVAAGAGVVDIATRWSRSRRWWRRLRGVRLLALLGDGDDAVPPRFADRKPAVRAAAAWWAARAPTPENLQRLLALLDDAAPASRLAAQDALMRVGLPAVGPLEAYLRDPGSPRTDLALDVALSVAHAHLLEPALGLCDHPEPGIRRRAVDLAGSIGTPEAVRRLEELLLDEAADVRSIAARRLGLLGHWPSAPKLGAALRDASWEVRRAAGLSLSRLGAPGQIYLRRALHGDDRFAADLARQIFDFDESSASVAR